MIPFGAAPALINFAKAGIQGVKIRMPVEQIGERIEIVRHAAEVRADERGPRVCDQQIVALLDQFLPAPP